jgi:hypothetical protein
MSLLAAILVVGLTAAGITAVLRTLAQDYKPELLLEKPLACDLCMSFWGSAAATIWLIAIDSTRGVRAPLMVLGGVAVALLATKAANRLIT